MKKPLYKRPLIRLILGVFIVGIMLGVLASYSLEDKALVNQSAKISQIEVTRIERFIRDNNPEKINAGRLIKSQISQQDLNLLVGFIVQKMAVRSVAVSKRQVYSHVTLLQNQADIKLSISLPEISEQKFINISASFIAITDEDKYTFNLQSFTIGEIKLPDYVAKHLANYIHEKLLSEFFNYKLVTESIKTISFSPRKLTMNYRFNKKYIEKVKSQLKSQVIPENLRQALIAQTTQLAYSSQALELQSSISELFKPMFERALERSKSSDPIVENKAVFIVLAAYAINKNISHYYDKKNKYSIKMQKIYLHKRHDVSQHFMVSAAIVSVADKQLAKAIGIQKEIDDSDGGSGFSFVDLAADYAGIRLAKYATENENQAREIQYRLATVKEETEYMPSIEKLAEGIYRTDLNSGFKSSEQYVEMEEIILERIKHLSIYQ